MLKTKRREFAAEGTNETCEWTIRNLKFDVLNCGNKIENKVSEIASSPFLEGNTVKIRELSRGEIREHTA